MTDLEREAERLVRRWRAKAAAETDYWKPGTTTAVTRAAAGGRVFAYRRAAAELAAALKEKP